MVDVDDEDNEDGHTQDVLLVDAGEPDEQDAQVLKQALQGTEQLHLTAYVEDGLEFAKQFLLLFVSLLPIRILVILGSSSCICLQRLRMRSRVSLRDSIESLFTIVLDDDKLSFLWG